MKLLIKYCGGCNPGINRRKLVDEVLDLLKSYTTIEITQENADVGLIIGGCPVCCINIDQIKDQVSALVIVGGNLVDYAKVPPDRQAAKVMQQVLKKGGERIC